MLRRLAGNRPGSLIQHFQTSLSSIGTTAATGTNLPATVPNAIWTGMSAPSAISPRGFSMLSSLALRSCFCSSLLCNAREIDGCDPATSAISPDTARQPGLSSRGCGLGTQFQRHYSTVGPPPGPPTPSRPHTADSKEDSNRDGVPDVAAEELSRHLEDQHGPQVQSPASSNGIHLGSAIPSTFSNVAEASIILQHANVAHLREELRALSERQATIPYSQLLDLAIELGAAANLEEAGRLASALCAAGVVLRFRQQVYLRPDEVAHGVLQALPDTLQDLEAKEAELAQQLAPLEERKAVIDRAAHRRSKAVMWFGFTLLVGQWSLFYWLTWYELSWDVMEPVAYFVSLGTAIGFYLYFLLTNEAFDYHPLQKRLFSRWQRARLQKAGFDRQLHDRLQADLARYRRYIAHFKKA